MKKCIWRSALLVIPVVTAAAVSAQQQEIEPVGPIPGWSFRPSVAIGTLFDSNLALTSPRADLGETEGDMLLAIRPEGELAFFSRRTDFSASYRGTIRRYQDVDALNGYDNRAGISLRRAATQAADVLRQQHLRGRADNGRHRVERGSVPPHGLDQQPLRGRR